LRLSDDDEVFLSGNGTEKRDQDFFVL